MTSPLPRNVSYMWVGGMTPYQQVESQAAGSNGQNRESSEADKRLDNKDSRTAHPVCILQREDLGGKTGVH